MDASGSSKSKGGDETKSKGSDGDGEKKSGNLLKNLLGIGGKSPGSKPRRVRLDITDIEWPPRPVHRNPVLAPDELIFRVVHGPPPAQDPPLE